jgi:MFS family permease
LQKSPFNIPNIRRFIAFRVFFNARFYYPVFTILFLDFGLSLEQFALLNAIWAVTIVLLEVPSGAFADTMGRRNLLVCAGVLMVLEMGLLCFAPRGNPDLLFGIFVVNRVLSGTSEAAASGADEALAYDSLKQEGSVGDWGRVLETQMRAQSIAFMGAMTLGAAVYDPALMQRLVDFLGLHMTLTQGITLRFPVFLTLLMAIMTLVTAIRMHEVPGDPGSDQKPAGTRAATMRHSFSLTFRAGRWILATPFALVMIVASLLLDSTIRMVITLNSQYYRLIQIPEASFGLIGTAMAFLGVFIPRIARRLAERRSPSFNLGILSALILLGLIGMVPFVPILGLLPVSLLVSAMYLLGFFVSHYLNSITSSAQRATVLSFKGLSLNLAYGLIGVLYSMLLALLRGRVRSARPDLAGKGLEDRVFVKSIAWFPGYFIVALSALLLFARWQMRHVKRESIGPAE